MFALVGDRVWHGGAFQQGQAQNVVAHVVAVLAIVQQRDAVIAFAEVGPLLGRGLEPCPVHRGVAVRRPGDVAPLNVERGGWAQNVHRERGL